MLMKSKKADTNWGFITAAVLAAVFLLVVFAMYKGWIPGIRGSVEKTIDMTKDYDEDGVINQFDKCCPAGCKTSKEVLVDMSDPRNGCADDQDITACTTDETVVCNAKKADEKADADAPKIG